MSCTTVIQNEPCLTLNMAQIKLKNPTGRGGNSENFREKLMVSAPPVQCQECDKAKSIFPLLLSQP